MRELRGRNAQERKRERERRIKRASKRHCHRRPACSFEKTRPVRPRPHSDPINTSTRPNRLSDDGTPLTHAELLSLLEQQGVAPGGRKREAQPFQAKVREEFEFESKRGNSSTWNRATKKLKKITEKKHQPALRLPRLLDPGPARPSRGPRRLRPRGLQARPVGVAGRGGCEPRPDARG
jgi:hypothetical protein